jgi:hypothetical protein
MPDAYARVLRRAAEILGGVEQLATHLGVPSEDVVAWMQRMRDVPVNVFLRAVDIVTQDSSRKDSR